MKHNRNRYHGHFILKDNIPTYIPMVQVQDVIENGVKEIKTDYKNPNSYHHKWTIDDIIENGVKEVKTIETANATDGIDFIMDQSNIDKNRIGITGESGGGTQCFLLTAIDDRIKVSAPVVMISSFFFGGCNCESGMPIHKNGQFQTNNVEIAALMAPKPMLMVSDGDDWTKFTPEVEYPFMKHIYQLYGQETEIENVHLALEKHDYGPNKRKAMYPFMAKHLNLDLGVIQNEHKEMDETAAKVLSAEELNVFNQEHPLPKNALMGDAAIDEMLR
jgi:hypothetical protein